MIILELAAKANLKVQETPFTLTELQDIDEAFVSSTNAEITPVISIDHRPVGTGQPGTITRKLQQLFNTYANLNS